MQSFTQPYSIALVFCPYHALQFNHADDSSEMNVGKFDFFWNFYSDR